MHKSHHHQTGSGDPAPAAPCALCGGLQLAQSFPASRRAVGMPLFALRSGPQKAKLGDPSLHATSPWKDREVRAKFLDLARELSEFGALHKYSNQRAVHRRQPLGYGHLRGDGSR
jgi:hypothetical protein